MWMGRRCIINTQTPLTCTLLLLHWKRRINQSPGQSLQNFFVTRTRIDPMANHIAAAEVLRSGGVPRGRCLIAIELWDRDDNSNSLPRTSSRRARPKVISIFWSSTSLIIQLVVSRCDTLKWPSDSKRDVKSARKSNGSFA